MSRTTRSPGPSLFLVAATTVTLAGCFDVHSVPGVDTDVDSPASTSGPDDTETFAPTTSPSTTGSQTDPMPPGGTTEGTPTATSGAEPTTGTSETGSDETTSGADGTGDIDTETGTTTGDDTDDTETGSTTGNEACPTGICAEPAPTDWLGPVVVYEGGDPAPVCPAAAPTAALSGFLGVSAPDATCSCACGDATGIECGPATLVERGNDCSDIIFNPQTFLLAPDVCTSIAGTNDRAWALQAGAADTASASCSPSLSESLPPVVLSGPIEACEPAAAPACGVAGSCLPPDNDYDQVCIYREGEHACPAGMYDAQQRINTTVADDRACSSCSCGDVNGSCRGEGLVSDPLTCNLPHDSLPANMCTTLPAVPTRVTYAPATAGSCAPSGGDPTGAATAAGTFTVCCASA